MVAMSMRTDPVLSCAVTRTRIIPVVRGDVELLECRGFKLACGSLYGTSNQHREQQKERR